jgi:transitional endoplasmic reticulum ATPase
MSENELSLKVLEAYTRDVGRGVARIDYDSMDTLNASTGDVVEIKGKRRTVAKCLPLYPSDEGKGIIRIDGLGRNNSGIAIGDSVTVKKIKATAAEKIVVAPLEAIPPIDERYLADALESVPLIKGDNVMVPYFGGRLTFQIVGVSPNADAVLVTQKTVFHIAEKGETLRGVPQVSYEDIGGLTDEIKKVREMIELPLRHPEIFEKLGIEAPKGVLLYGPPGTGKTLLAKAVANESNAHFISISGPEIMSKFYGESEARLREIFKEAREKAPSIVFIDEIDSIAPKREEVTGEVERRVVSQMLSLMDGLEARGKVIVISATNRPNAIDPALRRPGRFDREIEIKVPDKKGRRDILNIHTRNMPLADDVDLKKISGVSHGYVGADLEYLCKEAAMKCLPACSSSTIRRAGCHSPSTTDNPIRLKRRAADVSGFGTRCSIYNVAPSPSSRLIPSNVTLNDALRSELDTIPGTSKSRASSDEPARDMMRACLIRGIYTVNDSSAINSVRKAGSVISRLM